jgi:hypothetical protein
MRPIPIQPSTDIGRSFAPNKSPGFFVDEGKRFKTRLGTEAAAWDKLAAGFQDGVCHG